MEDLRTLAQSKIHESIATMHAVAADERLFETLVRAAEATATNMHRGGKLLVAGNGGSAADAQHLVAEFVSRLTVDRPAMPAIALTTDTSILTAIGNDYSYENVFERQIEAIGRPSDVFLAISSSGNSKNILKALARARALNIRTIGFSGNRGGSMAELCDFLIVIPSAVTAHVQECQLALEHVFCMLVERCYFGPDFGK